MTFFTRFNLILLVSLALVPVFARAEAPFDCTPAADLGLVSRTPSVAGEGLFTPEPRPMNPDGHSCISGFSSSVGGAASHTGSGPDCASATANLRAQLVAYADAECAVESPYGKCTFRVIHTTACYDGETVKAILIDGYTNFSCWMPIG